MGRGRGVVRDRLLMRTGRCADRFPQRHGGSVHVPLAVANVGARLLATLIDGIGGLVPPMADPIRRLLTSMADPIRRLLTCMADAVDWLVSVGGWPLRDRRQCR
ncbi:hypothetical protein GCM10027280_08380 [Micromonospora polyrhachis]